MKASSNRASNSFTEICQSDLSWDIFTNRYYQRCGEFFLVFVLFETSQNRNLNPEHSPFSSVSLNSRNYFNLKCAALLKADQVGDGHNAITRSIAHGIYIEVTFSH